MKSPDPVAPDPQPTADGRERAAVLWSFARPHLGVLVLGLVLALVVSAMGLAGPLVTKLVLDSLAEGASMQGPILLLVLLLVVGAAVGWIQWLLLGRLAEDVVLDARRRMILRYLGAPVPAVLRRGPGELVTRVTSDTVLLNQAASSALIGLINGAIALVGSIALMAVLDVVLLGVTLVAVGIVFVLFVVLMPRISAAEERQQAAVAALGSELTDTLRAIRTVKAAGAEASRVESLMGSARESRAHGLVSVRVQAAVWTIASGGLNAAVIVVLGLGAMRVAQGEMPVSTLVAFLLYVWGLFGPITELTQNLSTLQSGLAAAGRIREIEKMPTEGADADLVVVPTGSTDHDVARAGAVLRERRSAARARVEELAGARPDAPAVEFAGVRIRYPDAPEDAVRGVDLVVPRRGHLALVGRSGAGKTTMLSLMMRFLDPDAGEIRLFGTPVAELDHATVRAAFAYVEQETPVVPGTIRDNLLLGSPDVPEAAIADVTARLGLAGRIAALPEGLDAPLSESVVSGGERQRIALGRALLARPHVLLLDEPTAQVDGLTEAAIQRAIAAVARDRAVVTIAHRLSTVVDADRIAVVDDGRIVASGTHRELLARDDLYRDLVSALRIGDEGLAPSDPQADADAAATLDR